MSEPEDGEAPFEPVKDESVVVRRWRMEQFLCLGFDIEDSQVLTERHDVEIRKAEKLLTSGASHHAALEILL